jgi:hypothetical protein
MLQQFVLFKLILICYSVLKRTKFSLIAFIQLSLEIKTQNKPNLLKDNKSYNLTIG